MDVDVDAALDRLGESALRLKAEREMRPSDTIRDYNRRNRYTVSFFDAPWSHPDPHVRYCFWRHEAWTQLAILESLGRDPSYERDIAYDAYAEATSEWQAARAAISCPTRETLNIGAN